MKSNFVPGINSCLKIIRSNIEIKKIYISKARISFQQTNTVDS